MDDVSPYVKMNRSLVVKYIINKNSEDWKIAKTIADQILDFARTNGLTRSQAIEVFYEEVMSIVLKYSSSRLGGMERSRYLHQIKASSRD